MPQGKLDRRGWQVRCARCGVVGRVPAARGLAVALRVEPPSLPTSRPSRAAVPSRECGQAGGAGCDTWRPFPVPGDRGPWFLHAARERGPLGELAGVPFSALRFVRCTPARSSPRSPARPDAGPLNARSDRSGSTGAPVAHLRFAWCHVGRRGAGPHGLEGRLRCDCLARRVGTSAATLRRPNAEQRVRQASHRAPPSFAPVG